MASGGDKTPQTAIESEIEPIPRVIDRGYVCYKSPLTEKSLHLMRSAIDLSVDSVTHALAAQEYMKKAKSEDDRSLLTNEHITALITMAECLAQLAHNKVSKGVESSMFYTVIDIFQSDPVCASRIPYSFFLLILRIGKTAIDSSLSELLRMERQRTDREVRVTSSGTEQPGLNQTRSDEPTRRSSSNDNSSVKESEGNAEDVISDIRKASTVSRKPFWITSRFNMTDPRRWRCPSLEQPQDIQDAKKELRTIQQREDQLHWERRERFFRKFLEDFSVILNTADFVEEEEQPLKIIRKSDAPIIDKSFSKTIQEDVVDDLADGRTCSPVELLARINLQAQAGDYGSGKIVTERCQHDRLDKISPNDRQVPDVQDMPNDVCRD